MPFHCSREPFMNFVSVHVPIDCQKYNRFDFWCCLHGQTFSFLDTSKDLKKRIKCKNGKEWKNKFYCCPCIHNAFNIRKVIHIIVSSFGIDFAIAFQYELFFNFYAQHANYEISYTVYIVK